LIPAGFTEKFLPDDPDYAAPDGSGVRVLCATNTASMAHFELRPGRVSEAVQHRSVDELWYVIQGYGYIWRQNGSDPQTARIVELRSGLCLTIPTGTYFQFRSDGSEALCILGVTVPPWPGPQEASKVAGHWT
jgi:mannose-6-phosphate isomerase-like protein (cupin superfamily)